MGLPPLSPRFGSPPPNKDRATPEESRGVAGFKLVGSLAPTSAGDDGCVSIAGHVPRRHGASGSAAVGDLKRPYFPRRCRSSKGHCLIPASKKFDEASCERAVRLYLEWLEQHGEGEVEARRLVGALLDINQARPTSVTVSRSRRGAVARVRRPRLNRLLARPVNPLLRPKPKRASAGAPLVWSPAAGRRCRKAGRADRPHPKRALSGGPFGSRALRLW